MARAHLGPCLGCRFPLSLGLPRGTTEPLGLWPPRSEACEEAAWLAPTRPATSGTLVELSRCPRGSLLDWVRAVVDAKDALAAAAAQGREWVPGFQRKMWQVHRVPILHPHLSPSELSGRLRTLGLRRLQSTPGNRPRGLPCQRGVPG